MHTRKFIGRTSAPGLSIPLWAASFSLNILSLLMPVAILLIFDRVIPFQSAETLQMITLALLVSAAMELVLRWSRSILLSASAEDAAVSNYRRFMSTVLFANPVEFANHPGSTYLERYTAIGQLRDHHAGQNQTLVIDLPFTLVFAAMIGLIGGWMILVPAGALVSVLVFAALMKRAQWALFDTRKTLDLRRYAFLSELLSNMPTVKANRMEHQMTRRFEMLEDQTVDISRRLIQFSGLAQSFGAIFSQLSVAAMGLLGAYFVIQDRIGIAELAACMLLNGRIIQPLTKLMSLWVQSENLAASRSRLDEMNAVKTNSIPGPAGPPAEGDVAVSGVTLKRAGGSSGGAAHADFQLRPGTTALIEAEKGWMVHALFDALTGQYQPEQGEVLVDGRPASECTGKRGAGGIVALESEPAILSGTLLENLSAFGDAAQVERAKYFAARLGLEKRIHRLPAGYNTVLNTGSGFEKDPVNRQLIALTRVLAANPRILLMFEPTAVLDTQERQRLADCLKSLSPRPTILMASPDPRMQQLADATVRLEAPATAELAAWAEDEKREQQHALPGVKGAA